MCAREGDIYRGIFLADPPYTGLEKVKTDSLKLSCHNNSKTFLASHDRMVSYWNEYHRRRYPQLKGYVGSKLFADHFGYTRSLEQLRNK